MGNDLLDLTKKIVVLRGGPGSGNWGHTGRAGKRGGSGGGGGLSRIGAKRNTPLSERKKAAEQHRKQRQEKREQEAGRRKVKLTKSLRRTISNACGKIGCKQKEVLDLAAKINVAIKDNDDTSSVGLALQILAAGGLEKHLKTVSPDSVWAQEIYPKLAKKADLLLCDCKEGSPQTPHTYKSGSHSGAMIALFLPQEYAEIYALRHYENALPPDELHITLAYLGKADDLTAGQKNSLHDLMELVSDNHPILMGAINGVGRFCNGDEEGDPFIVIPDLPALPNLRELVVLWLWGNDIEVSKDHGFVPHITLGYFPHNDPNPFNQVERKEIIFPTITLVLGDARYDYPLGGTMETKAALVTRIGARHTGKEFGLIQQMHDLACDLGATCRAYHKEEKAGAKHSVADTQMIQRIHDDCVMLGAACKVNKTMPPLPMPGMRDLMHKSQLDAPNYRPAGEANRCENCVFFKDDPGGDYCQRFDFIADLDYVCDDWQPQNPDEIPGYQVGRSEALSLVQVMQGVMAIRGR